MPMLVVPRNFVGTGYPTANFGPYDTLLADYPATALYDGRAAPACIWDTTVHTQAGVRIPMNQLQDGDFDTAVTGWGITESTPGVTRVAGDAHAGTHYLRLDFGESSLDPPRQVFVAYASHYYRVRVATRSPTGDSVRIAVLDLETGAAATVAEMRCLNSSGVWTDTESYIGTNTTNAWVLTSVTFQAPSYETWGRTSGRLMVMLVGGAGVAHFDSLEVVPGVDVAAVVGHNFPSIATLGLYSGPDIDLDPLVVSAAPAQPVAFVRASALVYASEIAVGPKWPTGRWALRNPWMGELYVGQSVELRVPRINLRTDREEDQIRLMGRGHPSTYRWADYPQRSPVLQLDFESLAQRDKALNQWMLATEMGARPHLILPSTVAQPEACYFGITDPQMGDTLPHADLPYYSTEVRFREVPIALPGPAVTYTDPTFA